MIVDIRSVELGSALFQGDYANDPEFRTFFQQWVNQLWLDKDQRLQTLRQEIHVAEPGLKETLKPET